TEGWSLVATIGGNDRITHAHLDSLLRAHGVDCVIEGSIVYGVSVPTARQAEAISLIKEDLRERKYDITLHADGKELTFSVPDGDWRTSEPGLKHADLLAGGGCAASTDLGALLRTPRVTNEVLAFPYVVRIKSLEREYMDSEGKTQVGHEFDIEFAVRPDEEIGGTRLYFQVWDHGKQVHFHGSNEWWHGVPDEVERNKQQDDKRSKKEPPSQ
ncbi:MAG: hypothetical protein NTW87_05745, partial [Planctomycetota bacterium]|nr:hypothetical protein [Planctomycetota bacterium]